LSKWTRIFLNPIDKKGIIEKNILFSSFIHDKMKDELIKASICDVCETTKRKSSLFSNLKEVFLKRRCGKYIL